jgi:hypothetical protein
VLQSVVLNHRRRAPRWRVVRQVGGGLRQTSLGGWNCHWQVDPLLFNFQLNFKHRKLNSPWILNYSKDSKSNWIGSVLCSYRLIATFFQIDQSSTWGKEWSIVLSKQCTNIWLICILSTQKLKKIVKSQKCYQLSKPENSWKSDQLSVATTLTGLKPRQRVLPSGLQTLPYHLGDMHNLTFKIREDTTFQT